MRPRALQIERRGFLQRLLALPALFGGLGGCSLRPDSNAIQAQLIDLLRHHDLAKRLGEVYLKSRDSSHVRIEDVLSRLMASLGWVAGELSYIDLFNLDERVAERIRQDFLAENIRIVDGWLLAKTEADLCALAALKK